MTSNRDGYSPAFVTTQWTRVLGARGDSPDAKLALGDLCAAYYPPVLAFIRRNVADEESARDLTQEFFARLLARQGIDTVDRERGRFRSFLLGAVKHFLADMRDSAGRLKRGGGVTPLPIDAGTDTSPGLEIPETKGLTPDVEFDRKWALTVLDRALAALAAEHASKMDVFNVLKPWLTGDTENLSQADAAKQLGMNESALKVAIHRLRRRFRECVKSEIGQTLTDRAQVNEELACLIAVLGRDT